MKKGKVFKSNVSHIFGVVNINEDGTATPIKTLEQLKTYVIGDVDLSKYKHLFDTKPVASNTVEIARDRIFIGEQDPDNETIQKQIEALIKERDNPPKEHSVIGKKVWRLDRQKKIDELQKQINPLTTNT